MSSSRLKPALDAYPESPSSPTASRVSLAHVTNPRYNMSIMMSTTEFDNCLREVRFLERILTNNPSDTVNWILRSDIYQHLQTGRPDLTYTTEQLFFGSFVAGLSPRDTKRTAHAFSFLSLAHKKELEKLTKDNQTDTDNIE